jgi:hypothetical protein
MPSIHTSITINAPPSIVRKAFMDFASYPQWNKFIPSLEPSDSSASPGSRIKFRVNGRDIESTVQENKPDTFNWIGVLFGGWFFQGHHFFNFEPYGEVGENGETVGCKFVQFEDFSGIAAWLLFLLIKKDTEKGFIEMNEGLKGKAEAMANEGGS